MNNSELIIQRERSLLIIASLLLITGITAVSLARTTYDTRTFWTIGLIVAWFTLHGILRKKWHKADPFLLPIALLLTSVGLTTLLRLKPALFIYQLTWVFIGLIAFMATLVAFKDLAKFKKYKYTTGIIGICLLISAILFGVEIGGNKNWVIFGPIRFQPSEFAKLFIVLFLAAFLNERRELLAFATRRFGPLVLPHPRFIAPMLLVWGITMLMLVFQRDLGSALLYFGTTLIMLYLASGRLSYVVIGSVLFMLGSVLCYLIYPHVQTRVDIWLNPWQDPNGRAYQIVQSLFAFGAGGMLGSGLTYGFPELIPEVHTDFIFAAIAEELGFVGVTAVIIAYQLLIYRAFRIALNAGSPFAVLIAGGLAVFLSLQIFLIIGGVTKFVPLTGITLPLISYGGSSVVSNFILIGILFAISEMRTTDA